MVRFSVFLSKNNITLRCDNIAHSIVVDEGSMVVFEPYITVVVCLCFICNWHNISVFRLIDSSATLEVTGSRLTFGSISEICFSN